MISTYATGIRLSLCPKITVSCPWAIVAMLRAERTFIVRTRLLVWVAADNITPTRWICWVPTPYFVLRTRTFSYPCARSCNMILIVTRLFVRRTAHFRRAWITRAVVWREWVTVVIIIALHTLVLTRACCSTISLCLILLVLLMMMRRRRKMRIICLSSGRAHDDEYCSCYCFHISFLLLAATQWSSSFGLLIACLSVLLLTALCRGSRFAWYYPRTLEKVSLERNLVSPLGSACPRLHPQRFFSTHAER